MQSVPITTKSCEFESHSWWGVFNTHYVINSVTYDRSVTSSTNKTECHDITEILLKVALNTIDISPQIFYHITGNFCGVKFRQFWSKKMTFNVCGFLFLRIENLGTEKKIVCITGSNNWSDVAINNWCTLQWSLEVKTYLVL